MNERVKALDINMPLEKAYMKLMQKEQSLYPVFENNKLAGVINIENIIEFIMVKEAIKQHKELIH